MTDRQYRRKYVRTKRELDSLKRKRAELRKLRKLEDLSNRLHDWWEHLNETNNIAEKTKEPLSITLPRYYRDDDETVTWRTTPKREEP